MHLGYVYIHIKHLFRTGCIARGASSPYFELPTLKNYSHFQLTLIFCTSNTFVVVFINKYAYICKAFALHWSYKFYQQTLSNYNYINVNACKCVCVCGEEFTGTFIFSDLY